MSEILVVDDSKVNQLLLKEMLKDEYSVQCVNSGKELFNVLEEIDPKLILLDIVMPDFDGFQIIEKLKSSEDYKKIPVIFITGMNDPESEEKGFRLGAIDYIAKPFKDNVVKARVKSYVQLSEFLKQAEIRGQKDGLTGLYNKNTTEEIIRKYFEPDSEIKSGALMIIDIDNFKSINDTFGHLYGDAVLTQLGSALKSIFQKSDIIGRVGGDEFFVFVKNYNEHSILELKGKAVCEQFKRTYEQNGVFVDVSGSVGIATMDNADSFEKMYEFADIALYNVKAKGKNGFGFYTGEEKMTYKSSRTEIENSKKTNSDLNEKLEEFKDDVKEYVFNIVEESKVAEVTLQSILKLMCEQFLFTKASIVKFDYTQTGVKVIHNWKSTDGKGEIIKNISFEEVTNLYSRFQEDKIYGQHLLVSKRGEHKYSFDIVQNENSDILVFALRNKKMLLGYMIFEKQDKSISEKIMGTFVDISQQVSAAVIHQFLIENSLKSNQNMLTLLNLSKEPLYVISENFVNALFENSASKSFKGERFTADYITNGKVSPISKAIVNGGEYEDKDYYCKKILWNGDIEAYIVKHKI